MNAIGVALLILLLSGIAALLLLNRATDVGAAGGR
jgi:hypothetical protein